MKKFEIEHIGIAVKEPVKMANWYHEALGFNSISNSRQMERIGCYLVMALEALLPGRARRDWADAF